ncbi:MAG: hypothetical protein IPM66_21890 [Acidobacteriota bacterium]|nr:MAG: hypothetical protein IPM66_21890 [Acidobacteriota bacterium]
MKRHLIIIAKKFFNSLRRTRPSRLRKATALTLCIVLVLVPLLDRGAIGTKALAQHPILVCGLNDPTRIIQQCPLLSNDSLALENQVIGDLLTAYQLPSTDRNRLLRWERNLIRAGLFDKLLGLINKSPGTRTASEQALVDALTGMVRQRRILSATKSIEEYNDWSNNPCGYTAPAGFQYDLPCSCINPLCGINTPPQPPSFEEFQNYGAYIAYKDFQDKPELQAVAGDTARNLGILGGFAAAGLAAVFGGAIGASLTVSGTIIAAIHPFLWSAIAGSTTPSAIAGASGAAAGVTGAVSIAAVAAIVVLAIVISVFQGITVFTSNEIPGKLQQAKTDAENANIDLASVVATEKGLREVYAEFIQTTMPDDTTHLGGDATIPAQAPADRKFLLQPGNVVSSTLDYQDWSGVNHSLRLSGKWMVDRDPNGEYLTLDFNYLDSEGKGWTASRVGGEFLHTRTGDSSATPVKSAQITYRNPDGVMITASIHNAAPVISLNSGLTVKPSPTFTFRSRIGSVSDVDDPTDQLSVSVISPNPSNGVTLSVESLPDGVYATPVAGCDAVNTSFTLRVTDPVGASSTATLEVMVDETQAPVLSYASVPRTTAPGGSLTVGPEAGPSDPDQNLRPPIFGPVTVSPTGFAGSVTINPNSGQVQISNASPPGAYIVTVPLRYFCKTTEATFGFNVACSAITATVSGGGRTCPGGSSTVSVNVAGGTAPYTATLSDGQTKTSSTLPISFIVSPATATTYTATATDAWGCPAAVTGSATVTPDNIAPVITAAARKADNTPYVAGTWTNQTVTIDFTCSDNCSLASCPADVVLGANGVTPAVSGTATDVAGNSSTAGFGPVRIDKTPPAVSVTGVSNGATYPRGAVPATTCNTTDALSGVASAAVLSLTGGNAHGVGAFTARCGSASDNAGNSSAPVSVSYTVGYNLNRFVMLAREGLELDQGASIVSGDAGARASSSGPYLGNGVEVSIGMQVGMLDPASFLLGDSIFIRRGATVQNPSFNDLDNNGTALGTSVTPLDLALIPELPALPPVTPGTQNLAVGQNKRMTLDAGSYGDLVVRQRAKVTFTGGVYHFQSWDVGQQAELHFLAPTEIRIAGRLSVDQRSYIGPFLDPAAAPWLTARDIVIFVAGRNGGSGALGADPKAAIFGQFTTLRANVVVPNGTLLLRQRTEATGAFFGKWIQAGQQVRLMLESRFGL